jgi:hypothetical protein
MDRLPINEADDAVQSSDETLRQTEVYDEIREKTTTILTGLNQGSDNVDEKGKPALESELQSRQRREFKVIDFPRIHNNLSSRCRR